MQPVMANAANPRAKRRREARFIVSGPPGVAGHRISRSHASGNFCQFPLFLDWGMVPLCTRCVPSGEEVLHIEVHLCGQARHANAGTSATEKATFGRGMDPLVGGDGPAVESPVAFATGLAENVQ